jgi:hypothetical protein
VQAAIAKAVAPLVPRALVPHLPRSLEPVVAELNRLGRLSDPRNVYMYCVACSLD